MKNLKLPPFPPPFTVKWNFADYFSGFFGIERPEHAYEFNRFIRDRQRAASIVRTLRGHFERHNFKQVYDVLGYDILWGYKAHAKSGKILGVYYVTHEDLQRFRYE